MPKKRKTRKEKMLTDHKRQVAHEVPLSIASSQEKETSTEQSFPQEKTFSLPTLHEGKKTLPRESKPATRSVVISTEEYGYLGIDLLKTAIITGAIVITEIVIRILFRG